MCKEIQVVSPETSRDTSGTQVKTSRIGRLRWYSFLLPAVLGVIFILPSSGCRIRQLAFDEATLVSYRDLVWAKRAYNLRYGNCDRPYGEHFYNGFCAGYADICNGGDGYVPALPPLSYRSSRFQSADGEQCVKAWFEGYPAGVAAAKKEKVGNYNNVMVSKMMNEAIELEKEMKNGNRAVKQVSAESKATKPPAVEAKTRADDISIGVPPMPENDSFSSILIPSSQRAGGTASPPAKSTAAVPRYPTVNAVAEDDSTLPPIVTGSGSIRSASSQPNGSEASDGSSRRLR